MELVYFIFTASIIISLTGCFLKGLASIRNNITMSIRGSALTISGLTLFSVGSRILGAKNMGVLGGAVILPPLLGFTLGLTVSILLIPEEVMGEKKKDNILFLIFCLTILECLL